VSKIDTVEVTPTAKDTERPGQGKMVPRKRRGKQAVGVPGVSVSAHMVLVPAFRTSERHAKGAPGRGCLEHSRSRESSAGVGSHGGSY